MTLKTKLILIGSILAIILGAYFIGHHQGVISNQDDAQIKILQAHYDSLERVLLVTNHRLVQRDDTIRKRDAHIAELKKEVIDSDKKIKQIDKFYADKISSFTGASDAKLDSFFRARYPHQGSEGSNR